ncbi:hypothetical protein BD779DRAFT_253530 [Infundibulicybe gibba]|nr:hypothetical protein BD779DRAFT_253530 [Infundibulicybe gibba]
MEPSTSPYFPRRLVLPDPHSPTQKTAPQGGALIHHDWDAVEHEWPTDPNEWKTRDESTRAWVRMMEESGKALDECVEAFRRAREKIARELEEYEKARKMHGERWKAREEEQKVEEERGEKRINGLDLESQLIGSLVVKPSEENANAQPTQC